MRGRMTSDRKPRRARGGPSGKGTDMTRTDGLKALLKNTGPEADLTLRDVLADPCAFIFILALVLLALLA